MRLVLPAALLMLVLAVPIVWAWLRRPPMVTRVVSSLLLLRALPGASRQRRRLVDLLGLVLLLGALVAGALGLALDGGPDPVPWIAVVDGGPGMDAQTDDGRTRAARAVAALEAELAARPGAPVTLVSNAPAQVILRGETEPDRVLQALAEHPAGAVTDLGPLLGGLCAGGSALRWFGDDPAPAAGCSAERVDLGEVENGGLVEVSVRQVDRLGTVQVQALAAGVEEIRAQAGAGAPTTLVDGRALLSLPEGGQVRVEAPPGDAWSGDDVASLNLPPVRALRVVLITDRPEGFTATALRAHPGLALILLPPGGSTAEPVDLLVVEAATSAPLPVARRVVLLGVDAPGLGLRAGRRLRPDALSPAAAADPLLQHMHLDGLRLTGARALPTPAGGRPVLVAGDVPVLVEGPFDGGRLVALGFAPADSDLPLRIDFVHLVANLVRWADPTPGASAVAVLPGSAETAPGASPAKPVAAAALPRLGWWLGALLALSLLLVESLRALARRGVSA